MRNVLVPVLLIVALVISATPLRSETYTVCSSGCDYTSIQDAVDGASEGDTLELGPETFYEHVVPYLKALTIRGAGPERTVVDGGGSGTVFGIMLRRPGALLADMTIRNGTTGVDATYIEIDNCIIRDNTHSGVVLHHQGTINGSVITENTGTHGGGVQVWNSSPVSAGSLTISGSIISGNSADEYGGGVAERPGDWLNPGFHLFIHATLIADNSAHNHGGGIYWHDGNVVISNSTISGNSGEGIFVEQNPLTVRDSTIANNLDYGIHSHFFTITGSIVAANDRADCSLSSYANPSDGYNIASDTSCNLFGPGDMENTDPLLVPLADNGGPTLTHALAPGSPAIDAGGSDCLPSDQRGVLRPQDGNGDGVALCDIGAYELAALQIEIDIKPRSINPYGRGVVPVAILNSDDFDVTDIDVTTLLFGPDEAPTKHDLTDPFDYNEHLEDVNLDGYMDLMLHFETQDTGIVCGDTEATLTGALLDGMPFEGTGTFETVGCNSNRPHRGMTSRDFERMQREQPTASTEEQQHPGDLVEEQKVD